MVCLVGLETSEVEMGEVLAMMEREERHVLDGGYLTSPLSYVLRSVGVVDAWKRDVERGALLDTKAYNTYCLCARYVCIYIYIGIFLCERKREYLYSSA